MAHIAPGEVGGPVPRPMRHEEFKNKNVPVSQKPPKMPTSQRIAARAVRMLALRQSECE
jgi:hypothetical protein